MFSSDDSPVTYLSGKGMSLSSPRKVIAMTIGMSHLSHLNDFRFYLFHSGGLGRYMVKKVSFPQILSKLFRYSASLPSHRSICIILLVRCL